MTASFARWLTPTHEPPSEWNSKKLVASDMIDLQTIRCFCPIIHVVLLIYYFTTVHYYLGTLSVSVRVNKRGAILISWSRILNISNNDHIKNKKTWTF